MGSSQSEPSEARYEEVGAAAHVFDSNELIKAKDGHILIKLISNWILGDLVVEAKIGDFSLITRTIRLGDVYAFGFKPEFVNSNDKLIITVWGPNFRYTEFSFYGNEAPKKSNTFEVKKDGIYLDGNLFKRA